MSGDFSFLKGNINTIILCSLYGKDGKNGDKYGYEIAREIKERTENKYEIKQPTLYSYLKKLEQQQLIESYWGKESNGGRRRYYRLTPKGRHDCQQFMAEWEYHKTVLSTLVDSSETPVELTQDEVTPLFGERQRRTKTVRQSREFDEQDEIARRLDELIGEKEGKTVTETKSYENPSELTQQSLFDSFEEETTQTSEESDNIRAENVEETENESEWKVSDVDEQTETVEEEPAAAEVIEEQPLPQISEDELRAKFDVNQDNADEFMQQFEERARELSETNETDVESKENYQHVLMTVLSDQLDEMQQKGEQQETAQRYYNDHPAALEDVAENLARKGIRLRIYNHASSNFKSKTLMPLANVLCKTSWITFAVAAVYFSVLLFVSIAANNWRPFLITIAAVLVLPIAFSIYALYDPSRKEKPRFMFGRFLIGASTLALIIILLSLGISILNKIELHDFTAVSVQILIPTGIALLLPVFVSVFNFFYKKY